MLFMAHVQKRCFAGEINHDFSTGALADLVANWSVDGIRFIL